MPDQQQALRVGLNQGGARLEAIRRPAVSSAHLRGRPSVPVPDGSIFGALRNFLGGGNGACFWACPVLQGACFLLGAPRAYVGFPDCDARRRATKDA